MAGSPGKSAYALEMFIWHIYNIYTNEISLIFLKIYHESIFYDDSAGQRADPGLTGHARAGSVVGQLAKILTRPGQWSAKICSDPTRPSRTLQLSPAIVFLSICRRKSTAYYVHTSINYYSAVIHSKISTYALLQCQ